MCMYVYMCVYMCMCICIYIYIYIYTNPQVTPLPEMPQVLHDLMA